MTSESSEAAYLFRRKKRTLRPLFPALLYNMTFTIKNDFLLTRLSTNVNYYVLHTLLITYVCTYLIHVISHFLYSKYFAINFWGCAKTRTIDIAMQHLTNNGKSIEQTNSWKIKMVIYKRYVKPMEMARDMKKLFLRAKWDFSGSFGKRMKPQEKNYSGSWVFF